MVSLQSIRRSNGQIPDELTKTVVALFVGATGGIGMGTMKRLAELLRRPRFYFVGRSLDEGERVADELAKINPEGEYTFIQADVSLLKNVDQVCRQIAKAETALNILFLTAGTLELKTKTAEGLHTATALAYYSRMRFIANMLPLLQRADSLRRVVSVFAGTKEGKVDRGDWQGEQAGLLKWRAQTASMVTMGLVRMQETAPSVSFVHGYPGVVKTGITRGLTGIVRVLVDCYVSVERTPLELSADFHVFLATSARFTSDKTAGFVAGVGIPKAVDTGRGFFVGKSVEGREGGGVYSVNETGQTSAPLVGGPDYGPPPKVQKLMEAFRKDGSVWDLWDHTQDQFKRITGSESI